MGILERQKIARQAEEKTIDILARTIWGEARGEGLAGKNAVACVVLNRYKIAQKNGGYWWGNTIVEICQKPYQFSCWNKGDVNYNKIISLENNNMGYMECKRIAMRAIRGILIDNTGEADHYHSVSTYPKWADDKIAISGIGSHLFYKLVD